MATEEEEIRQELAEEGIVETLEEKAPAPTEEAAASDPGDVVDASNEPEEPEAAKEPEAPAPVVVEDPRDAMLREMREQISVTNRKIAEMERGGFRHAPLVTDLDEEILRRDPNSFTNVGELNEYWEAKNRHTQRQMEMRAQVAGRIASSEQHARGLLSIESVGEGFDYDSFTAKHVVALEQADPVVGELIQRLPGDPAMNRYTVAMVREIQTKFPGEPAKAVKLLRQALTGTKQGERAILKKIESAAKRQADRVRSGGGAPAPKTKLKSGDDVWDMDEKAFEKLDSHFS
jgi:hypothetical protein